MGGLGPPIARTQLKSEEFLRIVRDGKGMMPATPSSQLGDADATAVYRELQAKEWRPDEIPISFKVGALLTTKNVGKIFLVVFLVATIFGVIGWLRWVRLAGLKQMKPALQRFGYGKALGIAIKSLFIDGFLVKSLWDKNRVRWFAHGLMLYGMCGEYGITDLYGKNIVQRPKALIKIAHPQHREELDQQSYELYGKCW